ncbi:MAG TPA: hypothetical protein VIU64_09145 [Polyangia bacterium]
MRVISDRAAEAPAPTSVNRRKRRAYDCLADALRFQLEACREAEGLTAIVVSDQLGFCVAHSGGDGDHAELAARLPILASQMAGPEVARPEGGLPWMAGSLVVRSFSVDEDTLYVGAIAGPGAELGVGDGVGPGGAVLDRVASGFARLLAQ